MIVNPDLSFPEFDTLRRPIDEATRRDRNVYFDAQGAAERLFRDHMAANLLLVGVAYESGLIPLRAASIEQAIRLNGVAAEMNIGAFRWGRIAVARPELFDQAIGGNAADSHSLIVSNEVSHLVSWATSPLREVVSPRASDLIGYQNEKYAERYVGVVRAVFDREGSIPSADGRLSTAVARSLYKLMAYKDEYEVARLHLLSSAAATIKAQFGRGAKVYWHLHPPVLRALGMKRKVVLGPWFTPAFTILRELRRLRGTPFDVFGYTEVRRMERRLVEEYISMIEALLSGLDAEHLDVVVQLAELPDLVRGYEEIKKGNVQRYEARRQELLKAVTGLEISSGFELRSA
jgi:indolepyruvate ferredoxin oxidoreductase